MNHVVRNAAEADLDTLADLEVVIARRSFGKAAVDDHAVQRRKLQKALERPEDRMLVAEGADGRVLGWLWFRENRSFVTGERYVNLRSLAVVDGPEVEGVGEALLRLALLEARASGVRRLVGRVHVGNVPMRLLYRGLGFAPMHLTMEHRLDDSDR